MASLHFIITAPVLARDDKRELGRQVALEIEVEGSAGVKSRADLVRAARAIAAEELAAGVVGSDEVLGDFTISEVKEIAKQQQRCLTSNDWRGVTIWRVTSQPRLAA